MFSFDKINDLLNFFKARKRKRVLITGFGPFKEITENPSWIAVKAMESKLMQKNHLIVLSKEPIPVRYVDVDLIFPQLLDRERPHLTIHVGVGVGENKLSSFVLEKQAKKHGYKYTDAAYRYAALYRNPSPGEDPIVTQLDVVAIREEFNSLEVDLCAEVSNDAGGYLCEYIYYTSLSLNRCPTLFVHVPPEKYTAKQLTRGLERIIQLCIKQLENSTDLRPVVE